jgi:membrane-associated phospholipid phosphatase
MTLLEAGPHHQVFFQKMLQGDYGLFTHINQDWTSPFLDTVFLFMREAEVWIPFYLFLLVFGTLNFRKKGWIWSLYLGMIVIVSDVISGRLINDHIFRLRPCANPLIADSIRFIANYCPSDSGFISSLACGHFAMAFFIFRTMRHTSGWWWLVFPWAFFISYAQVYVGVHFPLDVFSGGVLGSLIGWQTSRLFRRHAGQLLLENQSLSHG